jgi:hypothetical protein
LFELGGELRAAVDLHRANGEGHTVLQDIEELGRGLSGGASVRLEHVPAGNHIASGERFEDHAGDGTDVQGIDFLTKSPGSEVAYSLDLRTAYGRGRKARRDPGTPLRGGSASRPCCLSRGRIRPTMETEIVSFWRRSRTASQVVRIITALPAIKRLAADAEVTASVGHVIAATIEIYPS